MTNEVPGKPLSLSRKIVLTEWPWEKVLRRIVHVADVVIEDRLRMEELYVSPKALKRSRPPDSGMPSSYVVPLSSVSSIKIIPISLHHLSLNGSNTHPRICCQKYDA